MFFILAHVREHTAALASWAIGMRIESLSFMPLMALSLAVSLNLGTDSVWSAMVVSVIASALWRGLC